MNRASFGKLMSGGRNVNYSKKPMSKLKKKPMKKVKRPVRKKTIKKGY